MFTSPRGRLILFAGLPIALLLGIQLIPVWLLQSNPPVVVEPKWDSAQTRTLAQRACFDCHSNETTWPWYSRVAPISWLVTLDVIRARDHLNFSDWGNFGEERPLTPQRIVREIQRGQMPPSNYTPLHPAAQLSQAEQQQLIDGLLKSLQ